MHNLHNYNPVWPAPSTCAAAAQLPASLLAHWRALPGYLDMAASARERAQWSRMAWVGVLWCGLSLFASTTDGLRPARDKPNIVSRHLATPRVLTLSAVQVPDGND